MSRPVPAQTAVVVGVDGCRGAWLAVSLPLRASRSAAAAPRAGIFPALTDVLAAFPTAAVFAIDAPIGLLDHAEPGGRDCDRAARALLGSRASSVFAPPVRAALAHPSDYPVALAANRDSSEHRVGISKQCFNIFRAIREADAAARSLGQTRVIEVHPELIFHEMSGGRPMLKPKKSVEGQQARRDLLANHGFPNIDAMSAALRRGAFLPDDLLDASAACWTARRAAEGRAIRIPDPPPIDTHGLRMEMWR